MLNNKKILVTGVAGFIGSHLSTKLLKDYKDISIIGIDNLNDYYDVKLKEHRLKMLNNLNGNFKFIKMDIADKAALDNLFKGYSFDIVVNLAAQAGVRYSLTNPDAYIHSNIIGFYNILEEVRNNKIEHLVFASSSSVYGNNTKVPFSEEDKVDNPVSLYAATKKSNELLAYTYSKLYGIPSTGLRFFTVYGPMGRPDMAYYSFTNKLLNNEKIQIFNYGNCRRDFTYIDDIVEGIINVMKKAPSGEIKYSLYNIGNSHPENLLDFVTTLSNSLIEHGLLNKNFNLKEHLDLVPMQKGDVEVTYADTSKLERDFNFKPKTSLKDGLDEFVKWYKEYYNN